MIILTPFILMISTLHGYAFNDQSPLKNIKVIGKNGEYEVVGEIQATKGEFYYIVEDGHNELIPETKIVVENKEKEWSKFQVKISIPTQKLPKHGSIILYLYKHGDKGYPVLLEQF